MECKEAGKSCGGEHGGDLIDTLWNVKKIPGLISAMSNPDLIDTLWNVKKIPPELTVQRLDDLIDTLWNVKWHMDESRKHLLIKR